VPYSELHRFIILFGALTSFILGLTQLLLVKKNRRNYLMVLVFFDNALFQVTNQFFIFRELTNWYELFPYANIVGVVLVYALLPLTFLWLMSLGTHDFRLKPGMLAHFIPAALAGIVLGLFGKAADNLAVRPEDYRVYLFATDPAYRISAIGTWIQTGVYGIWITRAYLPAILRANLAKRANLLTILMIVGMMAYSTVACVGYYHDQAAFRLIYETRMTVVVVAIFLVSYRFPFLLNIIKLEAYREGYVNPKADRLDGAAVAKSIDRLMTTEHLYRDGELTLKKMARKLGVTPHQLSEILNTRLGKSFPRFLKEKRIAAAMRMLEDNPELKIITVAEDCGFNSLSVFNAAFKSVSGTTPSQFKGRPKERAGGAAVPGGAPRIP
jgi:AraC-like DNA-binding protein